MILFKREHVEKIRAGEKTQTRRCWKQARIKEDSVHYAQRGYRPETRFARLQILSVYEEDPHNISDDDVRAEGFENKEEFLDAYYGHYTIGDIDEEVRLGMRKHFVINFEVIELLDETDYA